MGSLQKESWNYRDQHIEIDIPAYTVVFLKPEKEEEKEEKKEKKIKSRSVKKVSEK